VTRRPSASCADQIEQSGNGLVKVYDAAMLIDHEDAVFNGVEDGFQETPFARQSLDD